MVAQNDSGENGTATLTQVADGVRVSVKLDDGTKIATAAVRMHPGHSLPPIDCFPGTYRCIYRLLGFRAAETMAELVRPWRAKRFS